MCCSPSLGLSKVMLEYRDKERSFWDWSSVPLFPTLNGFLPSRLWLSRLRWQSFKVLGGDGDSRAGRTVFLLEAFSLIALMCTFTVASLPGYRERHADSIVSFSATLDGISIPLAVFRVTSLVCAAVYATLFAVRLACVTALPSRTELVDLVAAAQAEGPEDQEFLLGGLGGAVRSSLGGRGASSPLSAHAPSLLHDGWEDSEEEEEEGLDERALFSTAAAQAEDASAALGGSGAAAAAPAGAAKGPTAYERGGITRGASRLAHFFLLPSSVVDLLSFFPAFLDLALGTPSGLLLLRVARFLRVLRLLRATSETLSFRLVKRSLRNASGALCFSLLPTLAVLLLIFSAAIFLCEGGRWDDTAQEFLRPDVTGTRSERTPFLSVVHSTWFVLVTLSTLGYGDMTPTSAVGKVVTSCAISSGIVCVWGPPPPQPGGWLQPRFDRLPQRKEDEGRPLLSPAAPHTSRKPPPTPLSFFLLAEKG